MLRKLRVESLDLVVGTRNADGGSMGCFGTKRILLSRLGRQIGRAISGGQLSDPMSGFFLLRRSLLLEVVHQLNGNGFKILLDIVASSSRPLRVGELGYCFRSRRYGKSKLDIRVGFQYLAMVLDKRSERFSQVVFSQPSG